MSVRILSAWSRRFIAIPEREFLRLPFEGTPGRVVGGDDEVLQSTTGQRWRKRRLASGSYGRRNAGWRELYDGFVPDMRVRKLIRKGLFRWWKAELTNLALMLRRDVGEPTVAPAPATKVLSS